MAMFLAWANHLLHRLYAAKFLGGKKRAEWQKLWEDVEKLRQRAAGMEK
jgi:hypothetical protein